MRLAVLDGFISSVVSLLPQNGFTGTRLRRITVRNPTAMRFSMKMRITRTSATVDISLVSGFNSIEQNRIK